MLRAASLIVGVVLGCLLPGCVTVPESDGIARVSVNDVVKRIKCDLVRAVLMKAKERTPDGRTPFLFLDQWAAKLHFTLVVDDTATLNPGVSLMKALPVSHGVAQSFTLGLGAGVITEAVRTEDVEFLLSFSDMIKEFSNKDNAERYNRCDLESGLLLESDLHLKALIDSALEPIATQILYTGHNVAPGAPPPPPVVLIGAAQDRIAHINAATGNLAPIIQFSTIKDIEVLQKNRSQTNILMKKFDLDETVKTKTSENIKGDQKPVVDDVKQILANTTQAQTYDSQSQAIIKEVLQPLYTMSLPSLDGEKCFKPITEEYNKAVAKSADLALAAVTAEQANSLLSSKVALGAVTADFNELRDEAMSMLEALKTCSKTAKGKKAPPIPQYDPIDLISETVNFYVTFSGTVAPVWKLVRVTAPLSPTLFTASRKDTNTLILSMGRPQLDKNGGLTASNAMSNQILASILSQALTTARVTIP